MKKICLSLIILINLLIAPAFAQLTKGQFKSQDLDSGTLSFTTDFPTTDQGYLSYVGVSFSAPPESVETIVISAASRAGSTFDVELSRVATVAGSTRTVTFLFSSAIPVNATDQIKVTCTNASQSAGEPNDDPTVSVSIIIDQTPRSGGTVQIYRDGLFIVAAGVHDYRQHVGDVIPDAPQDFGSQYSEYAEMSTPGNPAADRRRLFVDNGNGKLSVRTEAGVSVSLEEQGHVIQEEGSPLTQRGKLNFTGGNITCTDDAINGATVCDVPTGAGSGDVTTVGSCLTGDCGIEGGSDVLPLLYEGTADTNELTLQATDPTADRLQTFQDADGQIAVQDAVLTSGSIPFINSSGQLDENNTGLFWNSGNGRLGIGTSSPTVGLHYVSTDPPLYDVYSAFPNSVLLRRAAGTPASPTGILSGQAVGGLQIRGYHSGGAFHTSNAALILAVAAEDYTSTAQGTHLSFNVTPSGGTSGLAAMRITQSGNVGIGTSFPDGLLDVEGGAIYISEITAPGTPASTKGALYEKTDGKVYFKNDAGVEHDLTAGSSGGMQFTGSTNNAGLGTSANTQYFSICHPSTPATTELVTSRSCPLVKNGTLQNLYCEVSTAPGSGDTRTFTVRNTGVSDTTVTCTISDMNTSCNNTANSAVVSASATSPAHYDIKTVATGTPASGAAICSVQFN